VVLSSLYVVVGNVEIVWGFLFLYICTQTHTYSFNFFTTSDTEL